MECMLGWSWGPTAKLFEINETFCENCTSSLTTDKPYFPRQGNTHSFFRLWARNHNHSLLDPLQRSARKWQILPPPCDTTVSKFGR